MPDRLAQHAHSRLARNGATSGSSSSPNTGPRKTGCKEVLAQHGFTDGDRLLTMFGGMDSGGAGGSQSRFPVGSRSKPGPHPAGHRCRRRRLEPPKPLLPADPLRNSVESEPPGATQRAYRSPRPEGFHAPSGEKQVFVYHFVGKGYKQRQQSAISSRASDLGCRPGVLDAGGAEGRDDPRRPGQLRHRAGR